MTGIGRFLKGENGYDAFARRGMLYTAFIALLAGAVMFSYIYASPALALMTWEGWIYLSVASLGHAATFLFAAYALYLIVGLTGLRRPAAWLMVAICAILVVLLVINRQVYAIYRFHINGFIINMLTGPGAGNIFVFDPWMVAKECGLLALIAAMAVVLYYAALWLAGKAGRVMVWGVGGVLALCAVSAHLYHAYAAFTHHVAVTRAAVSLPYFYPLTAKSLLTKLGVREPEGGAMSGLAAASGEVCFPLEPLAAVTPDTLPDIYLILLDSWNPRGFTEETMPNAWRFASENTRFLDHRSSSNGTRCSVFGIFFGIPGYYWESFEAACLPPPLIVRLQELNYKIQAYPSANLHNPDFRNMVFRTVDNLNEAHEGGSVLDNDIELTRRFLADMENDSSGIRNSEPRFSFLFYDLPHAIALPAEHNTHFTPAWDYADYTRLDNNLDPTEFWNLYRNCLWEDDRLLGLVFDAIERREQETGREALVILSGDHGQEFNENHKNYWGHSGNYSRAQIQVPLAVKFPGGADVGNSYGHRTTHYDFVPTLMGRYLGVENSPETYSLGYDLADVSANRGWHISGSNLNFAFITPGDTILEKGGAGELYVYDSVMNPIGDYNVNPMEMTAAMNRLNRFFSR